MDVFLDPGLLGIAVLGAGFLFPLILWRLVRGQARAAAIGSAIMFWATVPLLVAEIAALSIDWEEHGAPFRASWWPPSPELLGLLYPPFGLLVSAMLRWLSRRQLAAEKREEEETLRALAREGRGGPGI